MFKMTIRKFYSYTKQGSKPLYLGGQKRVECASTVHHFCNHDHPTRHTASSPCSL